MECRNLTIQSSVDQMYQQGFSLFMSFWAYLLYPPLVLSIDRHMSAYATHVHTDAISVLDKGEMSRMATTAAPPHARWWWSLPAGANMRDVLLSIRADDTCHAMVNDVCCDSTKKAVSMTEKYLDLHGLHVKGQ